MILSRPIAPEHQTTACTETEDEIPELEEFERISPCPPFGTGRTSAPTILPSISSSLQNVAVPPPSQVPIAVPTPTSVPASVISLCPSPVVTSTTAVHHEASSAFSRATPTPPSSTLGYMDLRPSCPPRSASTAPPSPAPAITTSRFHINFENTVSQTSSTTNSKPDLSLYHRFGVYYNNHYYKGNFCILSSLT